MTEICFLQSTRRTWKPLHQPRAIQLLLIIAPFEAESIRQGSVTSTWPWFAFPSPACPGFWFLSLWTLKLEVSRRRAFWPTPRPRFPDKRQLKVRDFVFAGIMHLLVRPASRSCLHAYTNRRRSVFHKSIPLCSRSSLIRRLLGSSKFVYGKGPDSVFWKGKALRSPTRSFRIYAYVMNEPWSICSLKDVANGLVVNSTTGDESTSVYV